MPTRGPVSACKGARARAEKETIASYHYRLSPRSILAPMLGIIGALAIAHLAMAIVTVWLRLPVPYVAVRLLDLNAEQSLGTLFNTALLLAAAALSIAITLDARRRRGWDARYWMLLAVGFAFLALDESLSFHEVLERPTRQLLRTSGALHYAWVIPYALVVLALTPLFVRFLRGLPPRTRTDFLIAGTIYLAGTLGLEIVEGSIQEAIGFETMAMELAFMVEEGLEMLGVAWFLVASLAHLEGRGRPMQLTLYIPPVREADREVPLPQWHRADREYPHSVPPPPAP